MDNIFSEKQQRLSTETLYSSWEGPSDAEGKPRPFLASANVGLFATPKSDPLVPDVFVSLDVKPHKNILAKEHRTYFFWEFGKPPDVVIEVVSNREGGELDRKVVGYARMGVPYYVVYDPGQHLGKQALHAFELQDGEYVEAAPWFESMGLGLVEWTGAYEGVTAPWLRWARRDGTLLPTGAELVKSAKQLAESQTQRAAEERQRAAEERQRAAEERQRAEAEASRAAEERQRAEAEAQRARRLAEKLRALGIDPDDP